MILSGIKNKDRAREKKAKTSLASKAEFGVKENDFLSVLETIVSSTDENTAELNKLWRELPQIEKKFISSQSSANLEEYKEIIKKIIKQILQKNTIVINSRSKVSSILRKNENSEKCLHTVKIIDANIQILATTMVSQNNTAFALLKQLEKIRGLLFDLNK